jgi:hypothetical protein
LQFVQQLLKDKKIKVFCILFVQQPINIIIENQGKLRFIQCK